MFTRTHVSTLLPGDVVWLDRSGPRAGAVVAWRPDVDDLDFARVVAGPGATVEIARGALWVDGTERPMAGLSAAARMAPVDVGPDAQFLLAECYNNGDGVDYNHDAAVRWYREAARQGHAGAKRQLSDMGYFQDE